MDSQRKPRGIYTTFQQELSPAVITLSDKGITVQSRADFPAYVLTGYSLKVYYSDQSDQPFPVNELTPGQRQDFLIPAGKKLNNATLISSKGFIVSCSKEIEH